MRVRLDVKREYWDPPLRYNPWPTHYRIYAQLQIQLDILAHPEPFKVNQVLVDTGSPYTIIPICGLDQRDQVTRDLEHVRLPIFGDYNDGYIADAAITFLDDCQHEPIDGSVLLVKSELRMPILGMDFLQLGNLVCAPYKNEAFFEISDRFFH